MSLATSAGAGSGPTMSRVSSARSVSDSESVRVVSRVCSRPFSSSGSAARPTGSGNKPTTGTRRPAREEPSAPPNPPRGTRGDPPRPPAVDVDADVEPVGAGGEGRRAEKKSQPRGFARPGVLPQPHERRRRDERQRPEIERREGGRERGSRGERQRRAQRRELKSRQAVG